MSKTTPETWGSSIALVRRHCHHHSPHLGHVAGGAGSPWDTAPKYLTMTEPPATSALLWEFGNQFEKFGLRSSPDGSGTHEATSLGGDDRDTLGGCQTSRPWPSLCRAPRRAFHGTSSFTGVTEELWRVLALRNPTISIALSARREPPRCRAADE